MELTREEELQAYSDALGAIVICLARQLDSSQLIADLKQMADIAAKRGKGPSAGLIDELARTVSAYASGTKGH